MSLTFEAWLAEQHERDDFVGAFARGLNVENLEERFKRGKQNEHTNWVNIVLKMQQPEYVTTFNVAWQEYLLEKAALEGEQAT